MEIYKCSLCPKTFSKERSLSSHMRMHVNESSGKILRTLAYADCAGCNKKFRFNKTRSYGKYCSNACFHSDKWELQKERIRNLKEGYIGSEPLKRFLSEERGMKCEKCGQGPMWDGEPLTLQLDHIDGNSDNNRLTNIRLLCPNCHTQTDTWCYRNTRNSKRSRYGKSWRTKIKNSGP